MPDSVTTGWSRISLLWLHCFAVLRYPKGGVLEIPPLFPLITELFPFLLLITLVSHPLIKYPSAKKTRRPLEKFVLFRFKSSCWVGEWTQTVPGSTGERILPEKHKIFWWGGEAWTRVEIMFEMGAIALQEYWREKENKTQWQTHWTHCSTEFESFSRASRITKTRPEGALRVLPLPGKGHLTPFREIIMAPFCPTLNSFW